jgi:Flp pilus assembly protein TadD
LIDVVVTGEAFLSQHRIIWALAGIAVCCALAVGAWRYQAEPFAETAEAAADRVVEAIDLLRGDPGMTRTETQNGVRAAAVEVVAGRVNSAEGYFLLAMQHQREFNFDAAEALFKRSIAAKPAWSWPHMGLGNLLARHSVSRRDEAEEQLRKAIELDPNWARPYDNLAILYRLEGRLEEAEEAAGKALEFAPESVAAHNNMANLLISQERYEEAETYYRRAIALDDTQAKPYYNLACLYSLLGRPREALSYLQGAIQRDSVMRKEAAEDADLEAIRDMPEFQRLIFGDGERG